MIIQTILAECFQEVNYSSTVQQKLVSNKLNQLQNLN